MDTGKESGRPAHPTPTAALSTAHTSQCTGNAANDQAAADVFVGRALRALRHVAELRMQDVPARGYLREMARASEAIASATWAFEYEAGLRGRGER